MWSLNSIKATWFILAVISAHVVSLFLDLKILVFGLMSLLVFGMCIKKFPIFVFFFGFCLAFSSSYYNYVEINKNIYAESIFKSDFTLIQIQSSSQWNAKVVLKDLKTGKRILTSSDGDGFQYIKAMRIGDQLAATIRVKKFKYKNDLWALAKHISYEGTLKEVTDVDFEFSAVRTLPRIFDKACVYHKDYGPLLCNMIFLSDLKVSNELENLFRDAGLQHVVVVSGSNLVLFVIILNFFMFKFPLSHRNFQLINLLLCVFFAFINGCDPSIVRACVMFGSYNIFRFSNIDFSRNYLVCFSISCLTILDPFIIFSKGFWLSAICAIGLVMFGLNSRFSWWASLISFLVTAPILFFSGSFQVKSLFINLIFVPLFSLLCSAAYIVIPFELLFGFEFFPLTWGFSLVISFLKQLT